MSQVTSRHTRAGQVERVTLRASPPPPSARALGRRQARRVEVVVDLLVDQPPRRVVVQVPPLVQLRGQGRRVGRRVVRRAIQRLRRVRHLPHTPVQRVVPVVRDSPPNHWPNAI